MVDVAIIGGGISGLATAYRLRGMGLNVVVLERQVQSGGNAVSERMGGFLMEHGPSTVASSSEAAASFSGDLGLDGERCDLGGNVRRRYLVDGGRLRGIATHPFGFLTSGYLSPQARLRLIAEAVIPGRTDEGEETVAAFCRRRFGHEFTERVMDPLVGGVYAGVAEDLSASAIFSRLVNLERTYGSVIRGLYHLKRQKNIRMPGSRLFSWRHGIGALPRALASALKGTISTGVAVRNIRPLKNGFAVETVNGGTLTARAVILATQPHVAAQLLEGVDADACEAAGGIAAPPLAVAYLGYRRKDVDHPLDGLGYLVARSENRAINGVQFCSTMFPGRAPEGCVSMAVYFGGARYPEQGIRPAKDLIAEAHSELKHMTGVRGEPLVSRVRHWPRGIPQYQTGHAGRTAAISAVSDAFPGLYVIGNYFNGPSVSECLTLARETAATTSAYLQSHGCSDLRQSMVNGNRYGYV